MNAKCVPRRQQKTGLIKKALKGCAEPLSALSLPLNSNQIVVDEVCRSLRMP